MPALGLQHPVTCTQVIERDLGAGAACDIGLPFNKFIVSVIIAVVIMIIICFVSCISVFINIISLAKGVYMLGSVGLFVYLLGTLLKKFKRIAMEFYEVVQGGTMQNRLNFSGELGLLQ